ncbi:hypothetical protein A0H81_11907 [Grifola frondosa]|uniref:DUF1279 domain-containing protein n=1 Tax=Grifola frondosa TaxID=5627 RepID=A0A1C7LU20_GRIFR|nr:hypothetical protein A0H81_11907 [Grifola frondosa]
MVRNLILRFPVIRALLPRITQPLLPLSTRLAARRVPSLTNPAGPSGVRLFNHFPARLTSSPPPSPGSSGDPGYDSLPPDASLSQRLKHLIKSYGWYALGVYFIISTLDFTIAFAAINIIGADHVSRVAADVKEYFAAFLHSKPPEPGREEMDSVTAHTSASSNEGLYAMLVLAYTIHKTLFLPVRVGLTAVVTPRLVGWLRSRGWAGGAGARRAAHEMRDKMRGGRGRD